MDRSHKAMDKVSNETEKLKVKASTTRTEKRRRKKGLEEGRMAHQRKWKFFPQWSIVAQREKKARGKFRGILVKFLKKFK
jgi:hypothetical protein